MTNIKFYEDTYSYRLELLNGSCSIPKIPGAYNIATGCGSGKTTIIKQLIKQKYNDGVIVFCKTIKECNDLYDYIDKNIVSHLDVNHLDNSLLHSDEVINLCSEPRLEEINGKIVCTNGVDLHWKDNLDLIGSRKVVIATHFVLLNTPIDKLIRLNGDPSPASMFQRAFNSTDSVFLSRKFMLIDELPLNDPIQKEFRLSGLMAFMNIVKVIYYDPITGNKSDRNEFRLKSCYNYNQFLYDYSVAEELDDNYRFNTKESELSDSRIDMIKTSLFHSMEVLANESLRKKKSFMNIRYSLPSMLMTGGINTNIWLFDGTGDITLSSNKSSMLYRFISYPNKYYGEDIDIIKIPNYLRSRNVEVDKMFSKRDEVLKSLDKNIDLLEKIIRCNKETLIIVWKNLKSKFIESDNQYTENLSKFILNDEFNLPDYYRTRLEGRLAGTGYKFHIIHYGSGLDLSTNEFRNCDSIVRLGLYQIPNYSLDDINEQLYSDMSMSDFMLYQNIQALSRTHIRLHEGRKVRFYISEDFNSYIDTLEKYLSNEGARTRLIDASLSGINKKVSDRIKALIKVYPIIYESILSGVEYKMNITLNDIHNIVPMTKEVRKYSNVVQELNKLGIELNII